MAQKYGLPIDRARVLGEHDRSTAGSWTVQRLIGAFVQYAGPCHGRGLPMIRCYYCSQRSANAGDNRPHHGRIGFRRLVHRYAIGKGAGDGLSEGGHQHVQLLAGGGFHARTASKARLNFEKMLTHANLGLYAEQIGQVEGTGQFSAGLTHLD